MTVSADGTLLVTERTDIASSVITLTLEHPGGAELPGWQPGAHLELRFSGHIRHYSLCGDPDDRRRWEIAVLREPAGRGGSTHLHDRIRPGDRLSFRGPRNSFPLRAYGRYLFIAGGIGITPILPMVRNVAATDASWQLIYSVRSPDRFAFLDRIEHLAGDRVRLHCSEREGFLDLPEVLGKCAPGTAVYACGPAGLLDALETAQRRSPHTRLHVERFSGGEQAVPAGSGSFEVVLAGTGSSHVVPPGKSILDVLEEAGVDLDWSCRSGNCGTCETGVLEGWPDHRDVVLDAAERESGKSLMPCVSRSMSDRLVLDL